jgi:hypothetical protein
MKGSLKLGRILGIDVYVHLTYLLLLGFVGLAHAQLFAALRESGETTTVGAVMRREFARLSPSDPLEATMAPANVEQGLTMPVQARDRLVGLLTAENIGELFMIRAALSSRPGSVTPGRTVMAVPPVIADLYPSRNRAP